MENTAVNDFDRQWEEYTDLCKEVYDNKFPEQVRRLEQHMGGKEKVQRMIQILKRNKWHV